MTQFIATFVSYILRFLQAMLFIRAILSWFPMDRGSKITEIIAFFTEPLLSPVRSLLFKFEPMRRMPLDFSTIIVYLIIEILIMYL